ncbi:MAG: OmpH family outer membrane protein [Oligoflexia bacterium]|nr:OmpH family outer membrane protein [Oligoflexia bacterium]
MISSRLEQRRNLPVWSIAKRIFCACLAYSPAFTAAEMPAATAVYVVDMQRVLSESITGKAAQNNFKAEVQKRQLKMEQAQQELAKLQQEIQGQSALLSSQALQEKKERLTQRGREAEREMADMREELTRLNDQQIRKVIAETEAVIKKLSDKNGYQFVISKDESFVVFVDHKYDITDDVLKALDAKTLG